MFDMFGYTAERKMERKLILDYENTIKDIVNNLSKNNYMIGLEIASIPEEIRGFGHVKEKNVQKAKTKERALLQDFHNQIDETKRAA